MANEPNAAMTEHVATERETRNGFAYIRCSCALLLGPFTSPDYADAAFCDHAKPTTDAPQQNPDGLPEIARFDLEAFNVGSYGFDRAMTAYPDGEWVKYSQVESLIAQLQAENAALRQTVAGKDEEIAGIRGQIVAGDGSCDHCGAVPSIVMPTSLCDECADGVARAELAESKLAEAEAVGIRKLAHDLWYEGGRLRSEINDSLAMHPEVWHAEAVKQRLAVWDEVASRYSDTILTHIENGDPNAV